jgi:hypothetical protein
LYATLKSGPIECKFAPVRGIFAQINQRFSAFCRLPVRIVVPMLSERSSVPEFVSKSEFARRMGVSEGAVRKHIKRGLYNVNKDGLLDPVKSKAILEAVRDPENIARGDIARAAAGHPPQLPATDGGPVDPLSGNQLIRARTAAATLDAQHKKLKLDQARGDLISREDARRACLAVVSVVNERIEGAAAQIAVRVAGIASVPECERIAKEVLRHVRSEIASLGDALAGGNV